jgi:phosphatidylethanolamine/phosphatidyl-N-methylethanolamine N-methyltransferase
MQTERFTGFLTFMNEIIKNPRHTGAMLPSGRYLAREMAGFVDLSLPGMVIELGPGTGVFTKALLDYGVPETRLVLVEYNPDFCNFLTKRFPGVRVINGSAFDLANLCAEEGIDEVAAIVSGLPLLNFPPDLRTQLVNDALTLLHPASCFTQFTYGFRSPVTGINGHTEMAKHVWLNVPPATIWTYSANADAVRQAA